MANKKRSNATHTPKRANSEPVSSQKAATHDVVALTCPPEANRESKAQKVITLLGRGEGVTLDGLVGATGWQQHTTRAALTGLRKKGYVIHSEKVEGVRRYRLGKAL